MTEQQTKELLQHVAAIHGYLRIITAALVVGVTWMAGSYWGRADGWDGIIGGILGALFASWLIHYTAKHWAPGMTRGFD